MLISAQPNGHAEQAATEFSSAPRHHPDLPLSCRSNPPRSEQASHFNLGDGKRQRPHRGATETLSLTDVKPGTRWKTFGGVHHRARWGKANM